MRVGEQYALDFQEHDVTRREADNGTDVVIQDDMARLKGRMDVEGVDRIGRETVFRLTIEELRAGDSKADHALENVPHVVRVMNSGGKVALHALDGELSERAEQALRMLFQPRPAGYFSTDDDAFGGGVKRHVGETWPVNANSLADTWKLQDLLVDPKDITGTCCLVATKPFGNAPGIEATAKVEVSKARTPRQPQIRGASMSLNYWGVFPVGMQDSWQTKMTSLSRLTVMKDGATQHLEYERERDASQKLIKQGDNGGH
ncbi:MAG: hypothetical protein ACTHN5_04260 [Phycisphaerae bacterium]